ncbi:NAD(P) transhydrogenase subunit beta [Candidatus Providencia siddallii]|uniref:NAD(P) transhydrogenase subunit beta n=1 Tax=Candidatus Providencia siddallii TaxID=1715285 RepID=A0A0M6W8F5_9GAMM|nr:NAD(P) transhydrogenase subunit beta [Candidatus Providencia siddallii]
MLSNGILTASYIVAAILFIFSLSCLSNYETSQRGKKYAIIGMTIALVSTIVTMYNTNIKWIIIAIVIGAVIGIRLAKKVKIINLPEMIVILYSFVGLSAIIISFNSFIEINIYDDSIINRIHLIVVFFGVFIGSLTFTGSIVAYNKLLGKISSKSIVLENLNKLNLSAIAATVLLLFIFVKTDSFILQLFTLLISTIISLVIGWRFVISIRGSDIPIVISILNFYSGLSAALVGFILYNNLLIIIGALVCSSGAILSYIMCKSMNRSFISVITGRFRKDNCLLDRKKNFAELTETTVEKVVEILKSSESVIITIGYGLIASQAQKSIFGITKKLLEYGIKVGFAINSTTGKMPGHMNVLLAEAKIPYDIVFSLDEINYDFSSTDTVLVILDNDEIDPDSQDNKNSYIVSMPMLEVWKANNVILFKQSMNTCCINIQNPLFFKENTQILFGDFKNGLDAILRII